MSNLTPNAFPIPNVPQHDHPLTTHTHALDINAIRTGLLAMTGTPTTIQPDDTAAVGVSTAFALSDHRHAVTAAIATPLQKDVGSSEGSAATFSRSDHDHGTENLPWGVIAQQILTADGPLLTADTVTDMVLNNVSVISGRRMAVHLKAQVLPEAVIGDWNLVLRLNGVAIDRFTRIRNPSALANIISVDAWCWWTPSATGATDDLDVFADQQTAGMDMNFQASATVPRTLTLVDFGV